MKKVVHQHLRKIIRNVREMSHLHIYFLQEKPLFLLEFTLILQQLASRPYCLHENHLLKLLFINHSLELRWGLCLQNHDQENHLMCQRRCVFSSRWVKPKFGSVPRPLNCAGSTWSCSVCSRSWVTGKRNVIQNLVNVGLWYIQYNVFHGENIWVQAHL